MKPFANLTFDMPFKKAFGSEGEIPVRQNC